MLHTNHIHPTGGDATEELIEVAGAGLRIAGLAVVILLGPPRAGRRRPVCVPRRLV
jgi:hypothetical protein